MQRCLELAIRGAGKVAPNPLVGAVLVYDEKIIGEGWHQQYGGPHAEVNCISNAIENGSGNLISKSTMYVSLEPCAHFGKTPPCADLIIQHNIPKVVIGCRDPFEEVNGKGIEKLKAAGIFVKTGILENECKKVNKRFFTFSIEKRPYVILKWAQTADKKIAADSGERLLISNEYTNRLVHQWRSEEAAILVGTNTALYDDPVLTNRLWSGPSPVRLVVDRQLRLPASLKIFNREVKTIVFNTIKDEESENLVYYKIRKDESLVHRLMTALYRMKLQSVLVEGGARLLQSFIEEGIWDEAKVIVNRVLMAGEGIAAPILPAAEKISEQQVADDLIEIFRNKQAVPIS